MSKKRSSPVPGPAASALGRELRRVRGRRTQASLARHFGAKSGAPISLYENGHRLIPYALCEQYAAEQRCDPRRLWDLRDAAEDEFRCSSDPAKADAGAASETARAVTADIGAAEPAAETTAAKTTAAAAPRRRRRGILVAVGAGAAATAAVVAFAVTRPADPAHATASIRLTSPASTGSVGRPVSLAGTIRGFSEQDSLWFATRATGQERYNPGEAACEVTGDRFRCGELFLGEEGKKDAGKAFTVFFLAVPRESSAEHFLVHYGRRDTSAVDAYLGLAKLPSGSRSIAHFILRRK